jgi:hypothetical protein
MPADLGQYHVAGLRVETGGKPTVIRLAKNEIFLRGR